MFNYFFCYFIILLNLFIPVCSKKLIFRFLFLRHVSKNLITEMSRAHRRVIPGCVLTVQAYQIPTFKFFLNIIIHTLLCPSNTFMTTL